MDVAYPFLLELDHDYAMGTLPRDELRQGPGRWEVTFSATRCAVRHHDQFNK